jgi:mRNA-degrading endonuclease RelE of RelBE toxin-antitoxin system
MKYRILFPKQSLEDKFYKILLKVPRKIQGAIMEATSNLSENPYPQGKNIFKKLTPPLKLAQYTAQYRLRIGNYRILYDVDEMRKIVWVFALRKRGKDT